MRVRFHLPDFVKFSRFNLVFITMLKTSPQLFREGVEIASVYGAFPPAIWNGGRVMSDICDKNYVRGVVKASHDLGIPLRFTFTNPMLEKKHLSDDFCNFIMHIADNGLNECIVCSPLLEEYIRKTYPGYTINSSTCKCLRKLEEVEAELKKDYGLVVLDYNLNPDLDTISKISDKDRIEILVNPCCRPDCPRRKAHYAHIGQLHRQVLKNRTLPPEKQEPIKTWYCEYGEKNTLFDVLDYPTVISPDDIWNVYVPMGFTNFKIEGRTGNLYNLVETYVYYLIKPEYQGRARIFFFFFLESTGVLRHNKPRRGTWP